MNKGVAAGLALRLGNHHLLLSDPDAPIGLMS
jgi:hypothetical protein